MARISGALLRAQGLSFSPADPYAGGVAADGPFYLLPARGSGTINGKTSKTIDQAGSHITRDNVSWNGPGVLGTSTTITYSFSSSAPGYNAGVSGFNAFSAAQIIATELALASWSDVANITFQRIGSGTSGSGAYSNDGTMRFQNYTSGAAGAAAFAYFPTTASRPAGSGSSWEGDVWINSTLSYNSAPVMWNYGFQVLTHEIGHAIGLDHPGEYNAGAGQTITYTNNAEYYEDTRQYSVMSYFDASNTGATHGGFFSAAPLLDDIAAAQRLYGANMNTRTGADTYGFNNSTGRAWFTATTSQAPIFAVWDAGGTDTFDFSGYNSNSHIDLREGAFSSVGGLTYNVAVAKGAVIENAIGGGGADTLIGNAANNVLTGGGGGDTLDGLAGFDTLNGGDANDTLSGGDGADTLDGGAGADLLLGGNGNDTYYVDQTGDQVSETGFTDTAFDVVYVSSSSYTNPDNVETTYGSSSSQTLRGNAQANLIWGLDGDDTLVGGNGNDSLYGGAGLDTVDYSQEDGSLPVAVNLSAGTVTVTLNGSSVTLSSGRARDSYGATDTLANFDMFENARGTSLGDILIGSSAANRLRGEGGDDRLDGGAGVDTIEGGAGADLINIYSGDLAAGEIYDGGDGWDQLLVHGFGADFRAVTVTSIDLLELRGSGAGAVFNANQVGAGLSSTAYILTDSAVQSLSFIYTTPGSLNLSGMLVGLSAEDSLTVTGSSGADTFTGSAAGETVFGLGGDDTLEGGVGSDTLDGGDGVDTFNVHLANSGADRITSGSGRDFVFISSNGSQTVDVQLAGTLVGDGSTQAGGGLAVGFFQDGVDKLKTDDEGLEIYSQTSGLVFRVLDTSTGQTLGLFTALHLGTAGADSLSMARFALAYLNGGQGDDVLNGGNGDDLIVGGEGNDTLFGSAGFDTLQGGAGADQLDGFTGADRLEGGLGDDIYTVNDADVVVENGGGGVDEVRTSLANYTLTAEVERLTGTVGTGQALTGNAGANAITGAGGADTLAGGLDNMADTLSGGLGDDTYLVDELMDTVIESASGGVADEVRTSLNSYTLGANLEVLTGTSAAGQALTGNGVGNRIVGAGGTDLLSGLGGADQLSGGGGNDILNGGLDGLADTLTGGLGDDIYLIDEMIDATVEAAAGGSADEVRTSLASYTLGAELEVLTGTSAAGQALTGNGVGNRIVGAGGADALSGLGGADSLIGGGGNDTLDGGLDGLADTLAGGLGDDTYIVEEAIDVIVEAAGGGIDTVLTTGDYMLGAEVENLTGFTTNAHALTGNGMSNVITGSTGADTLNGAGGDDTVIGGGGGDILIGGAGADRFRILSNHSPSATPDIVQDFNSSEDKLDLTGLNLSGAAYVVVQQSGWGSVVLIDANADGVFEQTVLFAGSITGADILAGVGVTVISGAGDQVLLGTGLTDALAGGDGADQIAGGAGNDSLYGQGGADVIYGQDGGDFAYGGDGSDAIVGGLGADSLLGEDGDDSLFGQEGADLMIGGVGHDGVYGGLENDTLLGGAGDDAVLGEEGDDTLFGEAGADLLIGADGVDLIFGGSEGDQLLGGAGGDTLIGEAGGDTLYGESGADTVYGGADADTLFGGGDGDTLFGDGGSDTLSGEDGADVLIGGTGGDVLVGGAGGDLFLFQAVGDSTNAAADLIVDFTAGQDVIHLGQIDADLALAGDQAFVFVTGSGVLTAGQARLTYDSASNRTLFEADVDGVAGADLVFLVNGNVGAMSGWVL